MHQNRGQLMRRMTSVNGAALLNGKAHAMSVGGGGGGYTMALVPRDRVDYSVAKGGLRQWAVLFVFFVLASSLYTVFSNARAELSSIPLDLDGDGDIDDLDADDDSDDTASLHASKRLQKDKEEGETPSRSPGGEKVAERRKKEGGGGPVADADGGDDEDADGDAAPSPASPAQAPEEPDDDDDDDDDEAVEVKAKPAKSAKSAEKVKEVVEDDEDDDDDEEEEQESEMAKLDPAELRAKEELMLRALKEKAEARRRERSERRMAKKAAKQAAKFGMSLDEDKDDDDDGEEEEETKAEKEQKAARAKAASDRRQVSPEAPPAPAAEPEPEARAAERPADRPARQTPAAKAAKWDEGKAAKEEPPAKVRFTRKRGRKHRPVVVDGEEPEEEAEAEEDVEETKQSSGGWLDSLRGTVIGPKAEDASVEEKDEAPEVQEDEEEDSTPVQHRRKAKGRVRGRKWKQADHDDQDDDGEDDDTEEEEDKEDEKEPAQQEETLVEPEEDIDVLPREVPVIRYTRTKGKFPRKKKRKPRDEPEKEEEEEPEEERKPQPNASRQRQKFSVDDSRTCIQRGNCGADEHAEDQAPIEVRYFRTKGNYQKKLAAEALKRRLQREPGMKEPEEAEPEVEPPPPPPPPPAPLEKGEDDNKDDKEEAEDDADDDDKDKVASVMQLKAKPPSADITNEAERELRKTLDAGDRLVRQERKYEAARDHFAALVSSHPSSPRAHYGLGSALDGLSEKTQSNALLEEALESYEKVLRLRDVPDKLYLRVLERLVDRARFRGWPQKALAAQKAAIERFPYNAEVWNSLGLTYVLMGRNVDAKRIFREVLADDAENGFALVHLGFILKTVDEDLQGAVEAMSAGMATGAEGTDQARFYFHLGDALQRLGKVHQAYRVYDEGARKGYFASRMQRSLYNVPGLRAKPWWSLRATGHQDELEELEEHWKTIRDEGLALLDRKGLFRLEDEKLTSSGDWRQLTLYQRGRAVAGNCAKAPKTCALVAAFPAAADCRRGQVKFSVMEGGTRVHPHCGPTNCRLRAHLGLVTPVEPRIRVANDTRHWKLGKWIVFDDSFEHEVWHDGKIPRLVLILDFWHPGLSQAQRESLSPI